LVEDLTRIPGAFLLYPAFLLVPGYVLGWLANVLGFRRRGPGLRILLSMTLSVAICPIITYLAARLISFDAVWVLFGASWLAFLVLAASGVWRNGVRGLVTSAKARRIPWIIPLSVATWVALCTFTLSDLQLGNGLYVSWVYGDYAKHIAVTTAISRSGVPPANPFFFPGRPFELFLYYFWWLMASLIDRLGQSLIEPRHAVFGGTIWAGVVLIAVVVLYMHYLTADNKGRRIGILAALTLLLISGLDLLPILGEAVVYATTAPGKVIDTSFLFLGTTGWNHDALVESWLNAVIWVPQHLASLVAGLVGLLLFRGLQETTRFRDRFIAVVLSGCAFASAAGLSVWVALVFAAALVILMMFSLFKKHHDDVRWLVLISLTAAVLAAPYLLDLQRANQLDRTPITLGVRTFGPADRLGSTLGGDSEWMWLVDLLFLPVNYLIEFGLFSVLATLYWIHRLRQDAGFQRDDYLLVAMFSASLLVCSFFRSSISNNDLGWRGLMLGQFVLLLWSAFFIVDLLARLPGPVRKKRRRFWLLHPWQALGDNPAKFVLDRRVYAIVVVLVIAGGMATVYDLVSIRSYAVLKAKYDDALFAERFGALRTAYRWVNDNLPEGAIIQHNPAVVKDFYHELYGLRRVIVSDDYFGTLLGIREDHFDPVASSIKNLFSITADAGSVRDSCREFSINALVVKDTDPVWRNSQSWVWRLEPIFSNGFARVFACEQLTR
jgi:hypothetical protein